MTVSTTPTYVNGKAGLALSNGGYWTADQTNKLLNNEQFSFATWIYVNAETGSTTDRAMIFGINSAPRIYSLFQYPTCNDLHWSWYTDYTDKTTGFDGALYSVLPSYQWTHICITYNNPNCTIYINGEKVKEVTGVTKYTDFNYQTEVIHTSAYHYLMDYRVYNHCLSFNEVKNIYKGLFLHYPLNNLINENLVNCKARYDKETTINSTNLNYYTLSDSWDGKVVTISYEVKKQLLKLLILYLCNITTVAVQEFLMFGVRIMLVLLIKDFHILLLYRVVVL
jgi:hypothetical protein